MSDGFHLGDCYRESKAGDDKDDRGSWILPANHASGKECQRADDCDDRFPLFQESELESAIAAQIAIAISMPAILHA
jgi:hypothetical protein